MLFDRPDIIRIIGAHNPLGAKLAEKVGFDGVWSSGFEISASYAVPDASILTMSDYLSVAASMAEVIHIPIVVDADTGYGNSNNVIHMVRKFEAAGVAAVCIEDKLFPKVNSFIPGRQELAPIAEFVGKIMAAKNTQRDADFMVIARVEALIAGWGQAEALNRAHAYAEAGADAILIHSNAKSAQPIVDFARAWDFSVPLVVVPTTYPSISAKELQDVGIKMVIYANQGLRASVRAMEATFRQILHAGSTVEIEADIAPLSTVFDLQGISQLKRNEQSYHRNGKPHTRAIIPAAGDHMQEYSMKHIVADIPLAMLDVNGKPLLQRQIETLNQAGISDITVVGGYKQEKIEVEGITPASNPNWQATGDLASIMCAATDFKDRTLIAYADILFDTHALDRLLASDQDITLLTDRTYNSKGYDSERQIDLVIVDNPPPNSRRMLNVHPHKQVLKIGKKILCNEGCTEFAGLALFSKKGFELLREIYRAVENQPDQAAFYESASLQTASLTDLLQELIDRGHKVCAVEVSSGWMEIRSFSDYKLACAVVGV